MLANSSIFYSPYVQKRPAHKSVQDVGLKGRGWPFARPSVFAKTPPKHARPSAPADLEPPKGLRLGFGLGSGWSRPTCKVEIDLTRPAQSVVQADPAHWARRLFWARSEPILGVCYSKGGRAVSQGAACYDRGLTIFGQTGEVPNAVGMRR